jgi:cyclophilin family peptidyl-prolyl cis-trans isomerase
MDNETKVTYGVVAVLIVILGSLAYFLQPMGSGGRAVTADTYQATTSTQTLTNTAPTQTQATTTPIMEDKKYTNATITTNKGVIEFAFGDKTPATVKNFTTLSASHFYNGVRFHRVIKDFMIQTGDPLSKDKANEAAWGTGGPGYKFNDELAGNEKYTLGTIAMANSGPNTNGSQFFIVTANPGVNLPPSYTVFGKVTKGIEIAEAIQKVKTDSSDRPTDDVIIEKIELH